MSHYSVVVFTEPDGKTVEELLEPFYEGLEVETIIPKSDIIAKVRAEIEEYKNTVYAKYLENPSLYIAKCHNETHIKYITREFPIRLHWNDEDCYYEGIRYYDEDDIQPDGSVISRYNPISKWDWYTVGGRFGNSIPLIDGTFCDTASMDEVDIDYRDEEAYQRLLKFWQLYVDGQEPTSDEDRQLIENVFYKKEYYTDRFDSAENFATQRSGFDFYAALLPNGEWIEPGEMGWWGISKAKAEDEREWIYTSRKILKEAKEKNWDITMVDCHI